MRCKKQVSPYRERTRARIRRPRPLRVAERRTRLLMPRRLLRHRSHGAAGAGGRGAAEALRDGREHDGGEPAAPVSAPPRGDERPDVAVRRVARPRLRAVRAEERGVLDVEHQAGDHHDGYTMIGRRLGQSE